MKTYQQLSEVIFDHAEQEGQPEVATTVVDLTVVGHVKYDILKDLFI